MRNDIGVCGVRSVAVMGPVLWTDVYLDIATQNGRAISDAQDGIEKVRPGFQVPVARLLYCDRGALHRAKCCRAKIVVVPDAVKVSLGQYSVVGVVGFPNRVRRACRYGQG